MEWKIRRWELEAKAARREKRKEYPGRKLK
jgi:hypothetical protein